MESTPPTSTEAPPHPRPRGDLRILVVEDNAGDRWYFSELLRSRSFTVVSCPDAETGWEVFQDQPTPVVLLDLVLPGMDGIELCRRIRAHPDGRDAVVLAVTGHTDPRVLDRILAAGANDFIQKPVDPHLLDIRLVIAERWIDQQRERQAAQRDLAEKTEELETLFRNLPDVFFSADVREERLIQVSPAARGILGHAPRELMEDPELWKEVLFPDGEDGQHDTWEAVRSGALGGPVVREYEIRDPGGSLRRLRSNLWVGRDPEGHPSRVDGVVTDITHQKRVNDQLAHRNRELAALNRIAEISLTASSSEEGLEGILREVTGVLELPLGAIEHLDRANDCLVVAATRGHPLPQGAEAETPLHRTLGGRAIAEGHPVLETDARVIREEGPRYLEDEDLGFVAAYPLLVGDDARGVLVLASRDPVRMDDHRHALAMNLANSVAAHVERLETEDALRENEARYRLLVGQLQQANKELESFAYSISHDLRAPLRTMQGFAHALIQNFGEELGEEARDYARRIIASGKHSEELISDLLAYSRLSFEKLEMKSVELDAVVATALDQVQADMEESKANVEVDEALPTVLGSRTILVQVFTNLLSNAIKFVPESRKPEVRIRAEEEDADVRVWVEDNGVGIPDDQRERIFRVFERLVDSGGRPGTGIGLAIVRRGVQRMGGSCGVERLPDRGSAFWIRIPRERRQRWRPWSRRR
jgi:PAS domain S-box-containing protein